MKKTITTVAVALATITMNAQDLTSKKGEPYLPEAKDWGLGADATPLLQYAGNFFGKSTTNGAPTMNFATSNLALTGKYFLDAQTAIRGGLRLGFGSTTTRNLVTDRSVVAPAITATPNGYPDQPAQVENSWKHTTNNIGLSAGIEKRRGKTRLQGFYGGEVGIFLGNSSDKFTYGNSLNPATSTNTLEVGVTNADAFLGGNNVTNLNTATSPLGRVTTRKNGSVFSFGIRGFAGVEYFILPKMSVGGEFGWGLGLSSTGASTSTYESVGNNNTSTDRMTGTTIVKGAKGNGFELDTDNTNSIFGYSGALRLNFYF